MNKLNKKVFKEGMGILLLTLGQCFIFIVITFIVFLGVYHDSYETGEQIFNGGFFPSKEYLVNMNSVIPFSTLFIILCIIFYHLVYKKNFKKIKDTHLLFIILFFVLTCAFIVGECIAAGLGCVFSTGMFSTVTNDTKILTIIATVIGLYVSIDIIRELILLFKNGINKEERKEGLKILKSTILYMLAFNLGSFIMFLGSHIGTKPREIITQFGTYYTQYKTNPVAMIVFCIIFLLMFSIFYSKIYKKFWKKLSDKHWIFSILFLIITAIFVFVEIFIFKIESMISFGQISNLKQFFFVKMELEGLAGGVVGFSISYICAYIILDMIVSFVKYISTNKKSKNSLEEKL